MFMKDFLQTININQCEQYIITNACICVQEHRYTHRQYLQLQNEEMTQASTPKTNCGAVLSRLQLEHRNLEDWSFL